MKLSRAALRPLLAAHERGALLLVGAAWGVTARKSSHNWKRMLKHNPRFLEIHCKAYSKLSSAREKIPSDPVVGRV